MPSIFADNSALLPSDVIVFAMLPAQRLGGEKFNKIMDFQVTNKSVLLMERFQLNNNETYLSFAAVAEGQQQQDMIPCSQELQFYKGYRRQQREGTVACELFLKLFEETERRH